MSGKYDDIINLPHHQSKTRPHMSNYDRAAQFSPFAALKGYDDEIEEAARYTVERDEPDEQRAAAINEALVRIKEHIAERPQVKITYFVKDEKKSGGAILTIEGRVIRLDTPRQKLVLDGGTEIHFEQMIEIL